jgi:7,8-dihydropterin-6-yl-methyl-4-(beta-D-ribofuranosyl)aminobenzene 5'-phosphate synthase
MCKGIARVYVHQKAFEKHYANRPNSEKAYIRLDEALLSNERFVFCGDHFVIDEELELFSGVKGRNIIPSGNLDLFMKVGETFVPDDFAHEQNLIIKEDGKTLLIAGCAHNGIANILEHFRSEKGCLPDFVIGGFHLYNHGTKESENPEIVNQIGKYLLNTNIKFYTCHCTGTESYNRLKAFMGENIDYLSTGNQLII